ncbi:MAG: lysophospholipid acyltransferase family protein [Gammaproteobacteria bacterium]
MRKIYLALLVATGLAIALPVGWLRTRGGGHRLARWWMRRVARALGLDIVVDGIPAPGPALWCANHISWLDVIVLGTLGNMVFVSKAEVREWPLIGWCARAAGTVFMRRGSGAGVSDVLAQKLRSGLAVAFFPEGTTSTGERLRRFHSRLFSAAMSTDALVQPVALRFSEFGARSTTAPFVGEDEFLPHLWRVLAGGRLRVEVVFAEPINPIWMVDRRALAQAAEVAVATSLHDLPPLTQPSGHAAARPNELEPLRA